MRCWRGEPLRRSVSPVRSVWFGCWACWRGWGRVSRLRLPERAAVEVDLTDPSGVVRLLDGLARVGADEQVAVLLARGPAAAADLSDPLGAARLLDGLARVGAD